MRRLSRLSPRRKVFVVLATAGAALAIAAGVQASIPDSNGVVHACYNTSLAHGSPTGALRAIDTANINGHCASWEAPVDLATPGFVQANQFLRLSSSWGDGEFSTTSSQTVYTKTVAVPNNMKTLTVTLTGTSDDHSGAVQTMTCHIDGNNCEPGPSIDIINVGTNDWHDNSVVARWCMSVTPGTGASTDHTLTIDQSSSNGGSVYIQQVLVTIDADTTNGCTNDGFSGGDAPKHAHH